MKYTWNRDFYEEGEERYTLKESLTWNKNVLKDKILWEKYRLEWFFKSKFAFINDIKGFFKIQYWRFRFRIAKEIILLKLHLKGKRNIDVEYSPYSESCYIYSFYDGLNSNYIKIRLSSHKPTKNDNSNIHVIIPYE